MNKLKQIAILLILAMATATYAEETDQHDPNKDNPPSGPSGRPTAPAKYAFACEASNGFMTIAFRNAFGNAGVDIVNRETGVSYRYAFDTAASFKCFVGRSALGYSVTVTLESGQKLNKIVFGTE